MILDELVDREEREYKRFREVLSARASAFGETSSRLTVGEVLFLYKHRKRIVLNPQELALVLDTWIQDDVPGLYWIKDFSPSFISQHLNTYGGADFDRDRRFSIASLKDMFDLSLAADEFSSLVRTYKTAAEAARVIRKHWSVVPEAAIWLGLRSHRREIYAACLETARCRVSAGDLDFVRHLRRRTTPSCITLYLRLAANQDMPLLGTTDSDDRTLSEFRVLQSAVRAGTLEKLRATRASLLASRPRAIIREFLNAILRIRRGGNRARIEERPFFTSQETSAIYRSPRNGEKRS